MLLFPIFFYVTMRRFGMIITKELINKACELTRAAVQEIINDPHANWGPKWVDGKVYAPGLDKPLKFRFGEKTVWNPNWDMK
jgi:hypothetical protein